MEKSRTQLPKSPTGIQGLDEITGGGLPKGRPTLVCGSAGCGKTLLAMEFLVRGATQFNEPGVFMAFEEAAQDLTKNVASLGFDLHDLIARKKIVLDFVYIERSEVEEIFTGYKASAAAQGQVFPEAKRAEYEAKILDQLVVKKLLLNTATDADKAKAVFVIKRSMNPGFAGIENELFYADNTLMVFGDAKAVLTNIVQALKE